MTNNLYRAQEAVNKAQVYVDNAEQAFMKRDPQCGHWIRKIRDALREATLFQREEWRKTHGPA